MDHFSINNLQSIKNEDQFKNSKAKIIAVSKTFPIKKILPLITFGHTDFGENKVQEALEKWSEPKEKNKNIKLHLIGKLQTNKVKFCLPLFDYIHSLDNYKLAEKISLEQQKKNFKPKIFIQVNIGEESQKNGIQINLLDEFINECKRSLDLDIIGLMCIPPNDDKTNLYFKKMYELNLKYSFKHLSMGMSADYKQALNFGATFIRIGSKIFGSRS